MGQAGRSNTWIADSTIWALSTHKFPNPQVLVSWTSIDRRDIFIDRTHNRCHNDIRFELYADPRYYTQSVSFRQYQWFDQKDQDGFDPHRDRGLLSLTNLESDADSDWMLERICGVYHRYIQTEIDSWSLFLQSVLKVQNYCEIRNIPYLFIPWQDLHHSTSHDYWQVGQTRGNLVKDYADLAFRPNIFPELDYLYGQVDWSKWCFVNSRNTTFGGIADFAIDRGLFGLGDDGGHPSGQGYRDFFTEVVLLKAKNFDQYCL